MLARPNKTCNYLICMILTVFDIEISCRGWIIKLIRPKYVGRKKSKQRIFLSWLLLTFFAAGQVIVYSHHHYNITLSAKTAHQPSRQTISDTCPLCDAMHFNYMVLTSQVHAPAEQAGYDHFTARCYDFVSISLILSGGRAPPISHFSA